MRRAVALIATVSPRVATGETRAVYQTMREVAGAGRVARIVQLFSLRPLSMRHAIRGWELAMWTGAEPRPPREFVGAAVSRLNDCHY
jgi:hypothetical protein